MDKGLLGRCHINKNFDDDTFVGIKKNDDLYEISFPLGFQLSEDEKELRRDILLLINVLARYTDKKEYEFYHGIKLNEHTTLPVQAYLYVIKDFFDRGIYKERETHYTVSNRGKIDWRRTIKKQKPIIQENDIFYLEYVVKKNNINEDELITIVHQYCVYESFERFGWLFTAYVPPKPKTGLTRKMMISVVNNKLQDTFNDKNKQLFKNLLAILKFNDNETDTQFRYGTYHFEYVWERLLDSVYGISGKEEYFPKTTWHLIDETEFDNSVLEPDTIMLHRDKVYVLDAKYYKYGQTGIPAHLPESSSINKQITYGEYIAESKKFSVNGKNPKVYNAFIMPFNASNNKFNTHDSVKVIGIAKSSWKHGMKEYENIVGILVDVKYLMKNDRRLDMSEIERLAQMIEKSVMKEQNDD